MEVDDNESGVSLSTFSLIPWVFTSPELTLQTPGTTPFLTLDSLVSAAGEDEEEAWNVQ